MMNVCLLVLALSAPAHAAMLRAPAPGPAPASDSFQDEVLDQADPEFKKMSGGGPCIGMKELMKVFDEQVDHYSSRVGTNVATMKKEERDELHADAVKHAEEMFKKADKNGDGCIDEKEWNGPEPPKPAAPGPAPAVKGPPTGETRVEGGDDEKPGPLDTETEFKLMDYTGDGKVSRAEAYHYVSEYMDSADLNSNKLKKLFEDADVDKDNYLTEEEFAGAGAKHQGDGKYKFFTLSRKGKLMSSMQRSLLAATKGDVKSAAPAAAKPDTFQDEVMDQAD